MSWNSTMILSELPVVPSVVFLYFWCWRHTWIQGTEGALKSSSAIKGFFLKTCIKLHLSIIVFGNLKRSAKKTIWSRYFMQLEHVCLPTRLLCETAPACFSVIREWVVSLWSDLPPHRRRVAASLCPVHQCFMLQDVTYISDSWTLSDSSALTLK